MRAHLGLGRWLIIATLASACAAADTASTNNDASDVPDVSKDLWSPEVSVSDSGRDAASDLTPSDVSPVCGDGVCARGGETCMSCPLDCNRCPTCDMAPSCTGALAVPTSSANLAQCDNTTSDGTMRTNYACGMDLGVAPSSTTCADPQLRIRVREMSIQRGFFDIPRNLYCVISAEDGRHSELLLITPREVAGNRNTTTVNLRPSEGVLWGQGDLYRSISNITITYGCFLASDGAAAQRILNEISGRAAMVSEHADGYGWVFGTVAVLGSILGGSLGTIRDSQILDVQQTVAAEGLLSLTTPKTWQIRVRRGNLDLSGASDLRLTIESWGCANVRVVAP